MRFSLFELMSRLVMLALCLGERQASISEMLLEVLMSSRLLKLWLERVKGALKETTYLRGRGSEQWLYGMHLYPYTSTVTKKLESIWSIFEWEESSLESLKEGVNRDAKSLNSSYNLF